MTERDYLTEAYNITAGTTMMIPERAHLCAVIGYVKTLQGQVEVLEEQIFNLLDEVK
jgi:hypothetical protein